MPSVVATKPMAARSQQYNAMDTLTISPVIASQFEAVRAPAQVGTGDRNPTVVTPLLEAASVPLQQQSMSFHDAIDALVIRMFGPSRFAVFH
jgi:hypothetical protein